MSEKHPASLKEELQQLLALQGFLPAQTNIKALSRVVGRSSKLFRIETQSSSSGRRQVYLLKVYSTSHHSRRILVQDGTCLDQSATTRSRDHEQCAAGWKEYQVLLQLANKHLQVPRPILYMPEVDGILMQWIDGKNLRRHLVPYLALRLPDRLGRFWVEPVLYEAGVWLRWFQSSISVPALDRSLDSEIRGWRRRVERTPVVAEDLRNALLGVLERRADLPVAMVPSHGEFNPRNLLFARRQSSFEISVIDWQTYDWRHSYFDLHEMPMNFLFWASIPTVSLARAQELADIFEEGYFGGDPIRDETYWVTRVLHLFRSIHLKTVPWFLKWMGGQQQWHKIISQELHRCIDMLRKEP